MGCIAPPSKPGAGRPASGSPGGVGGSIPGGGSAASGSPGLSSGVSGPGSGGSNRVTEVAYEFCARR